jgi:hypothetical protein
MKSSAQRAVERFVIWRRLDVHGMDACRFLSGSEGWIISGTAIFIEDGTAARLDYEVTCGDDWGTRTASVSGWFGDTQVSHSIERTDTGGWRMNGAPVKGASGLLDIDLAFTPATNTTAIRRLDPQAGQEVETTVLWLDTADWTLKPLLQVYRRKSASVLAYASPEHGYRADVTVDDFGVVEGYPGLWVAEKIVPAT